LSIQLRLLLRGVDYAPYVDTQTVEASNNVVMSQDGMSFTIYLTYDEVISVGRPKAGMEVIWQRWDSSLLVEVGREFAGVITSVRETAEGVGFAYAVGCQSYLRWFDRKLILGFFQQQTLGSFVNQVISEYCQGFTTNNVSSPFMIIPQYANYQRPSQMIKNACDQVGYGFYIDYYRDAHLFRAEDFASPLPGNTLQVDTDFVNYGDLELNEDSEQVYNFITIRGYKRRANSPFTLNYVGDGTTTQWQLGYRFSSATGDSLVSVNGVNFPVVRDILDGLPGQVNDPTKAYVHWTQHFLRFANPPAPGAVISFTGYPLVDRSYPRGDSEAIDYMNEIEDDPYSDGIYEMSHQNKSFTASTDGAVKSSLEMLLLKHGLPTVAGSMTSFTQGWRAGQMFRMVSSNRLGPGGSTGITYDTRWYVHRVSKKWIQPDHDALTAIQYTIEFSDKPYLLI